MRGDGGEKEIAFPGQKEQKTLPFRAPLILDFVASWLRVRSIAVYRLYMQHLAFFVTDGYIGEPPLRWHDCCLAQL